MDQIFDRFERLIKSWVNATIDGSELRSDAGAYGSRGHRSVAGGFDPDLDAAMAELDDYLDNSRTETERKEAEESRRRAEKERSEREAQARQRTSYGGARDRAYSDAYGGATSDADRRRALSEAYRFLGLSENAPFPEVKSTYKKLLFKYHPDRNSQTPEMLKKATEHSARINAAYQLIEAWEEARAKLRSDSAGKSGQGGQYR